MFWFAIANHKLPITNFLMSGFNLQELMSQAKQQYETLQKKMEQTVVEASAGGGTVTVKMDGRKQVLAIVIDPEASQGRRRRDAAGSGDGRPKRSRAQSGSGDAIERGRNARRTAEFRKYRVIGHSAIGLLKFKGICICI